jgi:hypothetical protein
MEFSAVPAGVRPWIENSPREPVRMPRRRWLNTLAWDQGSEPMDDLTTWQRLREQRCFAGWDGYVAPEHVAAAEASVHRLIDDLIALGPTLTEEAARRAVDACVRRFNDIDDGWICTMEREDIYEQVGRVVVACGFDCQEDWLDERDW